MKILFSYISASGLSCIKDSLSLNQLVKTLLHAQLKQTSLENGLHILTESLKEDSHDNVFQHFVDELKH